VSVIADLLALVEYLIQKRTLASFHLTPFLDHVEQITEERVFVIIELLRPRHPHAKESLRDPVQERVNIHRWRVTDFIDDGQLVHDIVKPRHVRFVTGWGPTSINFHNSAVSGRVKNKQGITLTQTHDDTVAVPFRMLHVLFWSDHIIPYHLHSFGVLDLDMFLLDHRFHKMLMCNLTEAPPKLPVVHDQHMIASTNEIVQIRLWSVTVYRTLFVKKFFDKAAICKDDCGARPELERIHAAVLFGPFCQSEEIQLVRYERAETPQDLLEM